MSKYTTILILLKDNLKLLMLTMNTMMEIITSVLLNLEKKFTPVDLSVMTRRSNSATSTPRKTLARSPSRLARKLWTPSILRSARRESTHIVRKHMREVIIVLVLLIITLRSSLLLDILDTTKVMEDITTRYKTTNF